MNLNKYTKFLSQSFSFWQRVFKLSFRSSSKLHPLFFIVDTVVEQEEAETTTIEVRINREKKVCCKDFFIIISTNSNKIN